MKNRKYRYASREAAERAEYDIGQRYHYATLAMRCVMGEGPWPETVTVKNEHYSAVVCAPVSACGGAVLVRWLGDKDASSDCWALDDFLFHARDKVLGLDPESFALREIAGQVRAVQNRAVEAEYKRSGAICNVA